MNGKRTRAKAKARKKPTVGFALKARRHRGRTEIVRVELDGSKPPKVIAKLPGRLLPKMKNGTRLGLDTDQFGERLERAFREAVKIATSS